MPPVRRLLRHRALGLALAPFAPDAELRAEGVVEEVERQLGFGLTRPDDLLPQLGLLLHDMQRQGLSSLGKLALRASVRGFVTNRLLVERELRKDPSLGTSAVQAPIFILGLQRTGTTYLQRLLALDPALRALVLWELKSPAGLGSAAQRQRAAKRTVVLNRWLAPETEGMHELRFDTPEECWWLFANSLAVVCLGVHAELPAYNEWLARTDMAAHYRFYLAQLKLLNRHGDGRRLVLKCPDHLWTLDALLTVFPDARLVWVHRDPKDVVPSCCGLAAVNQRTLFGSYDPERVGAWVLQRLSQGLAQGLSARARHPQARFADVRYRSLASDPVATVKQLYGHLSLPFSTDFEGLLREKARRVSRASPYRWELSEFGLDRHKVDGAFADYGDFLVSLDASR